MEVKNADIDLGCFFIHYFSIFCFTLSTMHFLLFVYKSFFFSIPSIVFFISLFLTYVYFYILFCSVVDVNIVASNKPYRDRSM